MRPTGWRNVDYTSHSDKAVLEAEVRIRAWLRKAVLINEACVVKYSRVTVHVIGRTKLPINCAGSAVTAGDTVEVAAPGPPHGVTNRDVDRIRHKLKFVVHRPDRHVENLAATQSPAVWHLATVLIENSDGTGSAIFSCRGSAAVVVGFSCGQECHGSQQC